MLRRGAVLPVQRGVALQLRSDKHGIELRCVTALPKLSVSATYAEGGSGRLDVQKLVFAAGLNQQHRNLPNEQYSNWTLQLERNEAQPTFGSSERRLATTAPAEPAPTTM